MKISQELPQFTDTDSLLVTAGSHHAIIYQAKSGEVTRLDELLVEAPKYSDNEGMFKNGSVLDPVDDIAKRDFSKQLAQLVTKHMQDGAHAHIYLFIPSEMKHFIEKDWSNDLKSKIIHEFNGNYVSRGINELIEMIKKERGTIDTNPATGEAKKILDINS